MKYILCITVFLAITQAAVGQSTNDTIWAYAEIKEHMGGVSFDFGKHKNIKTYIDDLLISPKTGRRTLFSSLPAAMNLLTELGWEFVQAYATTNGSHGDKFWVVRAKVKKNEKGEYELLKMLAPSEVNKRE